MKNEKQVKLVDDDFVPESASEATSCPESCPEPCPEPPENLSFEAQQEWIKCAPQFHALDMLHGFVSSLVENYCQAQANVRVARAYVQTDGRVINGKLHPCVNDELNHMKEARAYGNELSSLIEAHENRQIKLRELALEEAKLKANDNSPWKNKEQLLA